MRSEISKEIDKLSLDRERFSLVNITQWKNIENKIADSFLQNGISDKNYVLWWEHFKEKNTAFPCDNSLEILPQIIPNDEKIYLYIEDFDREAKFWLYEGYIKEICMILGELYFVEYYLVSKKMEWLVCENHHEVLMAIGEEIERKLKKFFAKQKVQS